MKHISLSYLLLAVMLLCLRPHHSTAQSTVENTSTDMRLISGPTATNPDDITHSFLVRRVSPRIDYAPVLRIVNNGRVGIGLNLNFKDPVSMLNVGEDANRVSIDDAGSSRLNGGLGRNDFIAGAGACIGFNVSRKADASYECNPGIINAGNPNSEKRNGGALIWAGLDGALNFTCLPSANGGNVNTPNTNYYYANHVQSYRAMKILPSMQVQIGLALPTNHTDYRLAVDGKLVAKSIFVTQGNNWADFVFAPTYALQPLPELEAYLKQNRHLPAIPSAAEVEKNGVDLGDMNAKLLQSLEELTLHVIELGKQNARLQAEVAALAARVDQAADASVVGK